MSRPSRRDLLDQMKREQKSNNAQDYWDDLGRRLREGHVVPIISDSVRNDLIFGQLFDTAAQAITVTVDEAANTSEPESTRPEPRFDEMLADLWANELGYPFLWGNSLPGIAQYNCVMSDDCDQANHKYLTFLKETVLWLAQKGAPDIREVVDELRLQIEGLAFSDIITELNYPHFESKEDDSLRILARFNQLPIYITTSYYNFIERALCAEGREPRTQICFWREEPKNIEDEHCFDRDYEPTPEHPVVYHLFGFEEYPTTMALAEDDYVDFLIKMSKPVDKENPMIPLYLSDALAQNTLVLLGYRLQDWDFRTLFRGIILSQSRTDTRFSLAIQLKPSSQDGITDKELIARAQSYLKRYFEPFNFKVWWGDVDTFVKNLWKKWNEARQV